MRNFSPHTQRWYVQQVSQFSRYCQHSPDRLGQEEIRGHQLLSADEVSSFSTVWQG